MFQVVKRWKDKRLFLSSTLFEKEPFLPRYFNLYPINLKLSRAHAYTGAGDLRISFRPLL